MKLVDILGNEIVSIECKETEHFNRQIDMKALVPGLYVLEMRIGNETLHRKVIKE